MLHKSLSAPCIGNLTSTRGLAERPPVAGALRSGDTFDAGAVPGMRETKMPVIVLESPNEQVIPVYFRVPGRDVHVYAGQLRVTGSDRVQLQPIVQHEPDRIIIHDPAVVNDRQIDVVQLEPQLITLAASPPAAVSPQP